MFEGQPWLLSNIIDETTSKIPEKLHEYVILERCGVRIGLIGLVEKYDILGSDKCLGSFTFQGMDSDCAFLAC